MNLAELRLWKETFGEWFRNTLFYSLLFFIGWVGIAPMGWFIFKIFPLILSVSVIPWLVVTGVILWKEGQNKKILAEKERIEKGLEKRSFKDNLKFFIGIVAILFLFLLWALYYAFGALLGVLLVHVVLFFMGVVENPFSDQSSVWGWTAGLLVIWY